MCVPWLIDMCAVTYCSIAMGGLHDGRHVVHVALTSLGIFCCSVLQCVAVCCSVLQCVAVCCSVLWAACSARCPYFPWYLMLQYVAVLQCVAVCCSVLQCVAVCYSGWHCVAVCCSVLQCVTVCCNVLQCVAIEERTAVAKGDSGHDRRDWVRDDWLSSRRLIKMTHWVCHDSWLIEFATTDWVRDVCNIHTYLYVFIKTSRDVTGGIEFVTTDWVRDDSLRWLIEFVMTLTHWVRDDWLSSWHVQHSHLSLYIYKSFLGRDRREFLTTDWVRDDSLRWFIQMTHIQLVVMTHEDDSLSSWHALWWLIEFVMTL